MDVRRFRQRFWLPSVLAFLAVQTLSAQRKPLTLDDIYSPTTRVNFSGAPAPAFDWIDGDHYIWPPSAADNRESVEWMKVDAATGSSVPVVRRREAEAAVSTLAGAAADARRLARSRDLIFNHTHSAALITIADDLYLYSFADHRIVRLTSTAGEEEERRSARTTRGSPSFATTTCSLSMPRRSTRRR